MTTFDEAMADFLRDLSGMFPGHFMLGVIAAAFPAVAAAAPGAPLQGFLEGVAPFAGLLAERDPALFDVALFPGLESLDLKGLWGSLDDQRRDGLWDRMQALYALAAGTP